MKAFSLTRTNIQEYNLPLSMVFLLLLLFSAPETAVSTQKVGRGASDKRTSEHCKKVPPLI